MGNPFLENSDDLLVLDSRNIADVAVVSDAIKEIEDLGIDQHEAYIEDRLVKQTKTIADQTIFISLVDLQFIRSQANSCNFHDCSLFSRLCIASQTQNGYLDDFFSHKNQVCPPVLSKMGISREENKSELHTAWKSLFHSKNLCLVLGWKSSYLTVLLLLKC